MCMGLQFKKMILCLDQKGSAADLIMKKKETNRRKCNGEERVGKDRTIYIFFQKRTEGHE